MALVLEQFNPTRRWRVGRAGLTARNLYSCRRQECNRASSPAFLMYLRIPQAVKKAVSCQNKTTQSVVLFFIVSRKPPAVPVVPKSFSYAQNKISERSEEQLLRSKDRKSIKLRKSGKEKPYRYFNSSRASHASERKFDEPIGSAGKRP